MPLIRLKKYVFYVCIGFSLCLAGCSTLTTYQPPASQRGNEIKKIQALTHWKLAGAIAVQSPKTHGNASLTWQQDEKDYQLHFFGLLGMGSIYLTGTPQGVNLVTAQGQKLSAKNPEDLLAQLGWQLPVSNLVYWIRGLPSPKLQVQGIETANGLVQKMQQQDWQIDYLAYQNIQGIRLPTKINIINPALKAKIAIYDWELASSGDRYFYHERGN